MAGKGANGTRATGKYYAPVYRAKKSPVKVRQIKLIKRCALIAAAVAIAVVWIVSLRTGRDEDRSFVRVAASDQSLAGVESYPRVVNHSAPLPEDYVPENLMSLNTLPNGENVYLRADAAEAFLSMCGAMSEDGLGIVPVMGYVSYEEQSHVLSAAADRLIAEGASADEAMKLAQAEVSAPGEDEAQLGTSVDISTDTSASAAFSLTDQYQWVCHNAYRYGFIIRYTTRKKNITGKGEQPWRLRYVGTEAAEYMLSANMCLEEYTEAVRNDNPEATEEL